MISSLAPLANAWDRMLSGALLDPWHLTMAGGTNDVNSDTSRQAVASLTRLHVFFFALIGPREEGSCAAPTNLLSTHQRHRFVGGFCSRTRLSLRLEGPVFIWRNPICRCDD